VASKSGKTVEPLTLLEHFWSKAGRNADKANHFAAITDPGTPLEALARDRHFKRIISSPPDVGGRYSALSVFGLVPAAAAGVDIRALLEGGSRMARQCGPNVDAPRNPGAFLGAVLAAAWEEGRDKVTLVADPDLEAFLPWVEQLLAESSGKHGKGIVPVVGEPPGSAGHYRQDRLIVYLRRGGALDRKVERWVRARIPVAILEVQPGVRGVGGEFFRWEMATAIACHGIGVNAFDQPDVESAKVAARESLAAGGAPAAGDEETEWKLEGPDGMTAPPSDLVDALRPVAESLRPGDAFALLLFVPENPAARRAALKMRRAVRDRLGNATVVGFGPRYLHSTGQLFKGGSDHLVALYLDARPGRDLTVAGVEHSLGELMHAQAVGDFKAMKARGRRAYFLSLESSKVVAAVARAFVEAVGSVPAPAGR
jgi:transaldolase/glucose-6-phosphate isomerase